MRRVLLAILGLVISLSAFQRRTDAQAQPPSATQPSGRLAPPAGHPTSLQGRYAAPAASIYVEFRPDGTLSWKNGDKTHDGTYKVDGATITTRIGSGSNEFRAIGDVLVSLRNGGILERQPDSPAVGMQSPSGVEAPSAAPGSSMPDIEAWVNHELPPMGSDKIVSRSGETQYKTLYAIQSAVLRQCRLTLTAGSKPDFLDSAAMDTATVALKDVDLSKLVPLEEAVAPDTTKSKASFTVPLVALPDRGKAFTSVRQQKGSDWVTSTISAVSVRVRDQEQATKVAEMLRRAAILCGAPEPPPNARVADTTPVRQGSSALPPSSGPGTMTNTEVIQLVTAGLSEQVVTTAIWQAPTKDFDLTPMGLIALKKAGVSDAVIVVMQEKGTPAQATSTSDAKTPPKYDASLAEPPKSAPAPVAQTGCSGIGLMGLYKNEIFDRAMGGGIVERKLSMGLRHEGLAFSEPPRETFALAREWLVG